MRLGIASARRAREVATSFGPRVADVRRAHGWSQRELAARIGTTQSRICRFERGDPSAFDLELLLAATDELGIRPSFRLEAPMLADRRDLADAGHARCVGYVARRLETWGWETAIEEEVGAPPWRSWIDILAYHHRAQALLIQEVKTELHDAGGEQRRLARYERDAWEAARGRGWRPTSLVSGLVLLMTTRNEERLAELAELLRRGFPVRASQLSAWLRDPSSARPPGRTLALIDPRSRRDGWLRPTLLDGRRTPAPYRGYADFMRHLRAA